MTPKVFNENGIISAFYIPVYWRGDRNQFNFGRLLDFHIFDFGNKENMNRFISVTILGLQVNLRIKIKTKAKG